MLCTPWIDPQECEGVTDPPEGEAERAALIASWLLFLATGGVFPGVCLDTIVACGSCGHRVCGCGYGRCDEGDYLDLPGFPIVNIAEVVIDDEAVAAADLTIEDNRRLILTPGLAWGTDWSVTYRWGAGPPEHLVHAAELLACQLQTGWSGDSEECDLPDEVISATRENLTMEFASIEDLLTGGAFGNIHIDRAVASARTDPGGVVLLARNFTRPPHRRIRPVTYAPVP